MGVRWQWVLNIRRWMDSKLWYVSLRPGPSFCPLYPIPFVISIPFVVFISYGPSILFVISIPFGPFIPFATFLPFILFHEVS
jgi:hypothetical protein